MESRKLLQALPSTDYGAISVEAGDGFVNRVSIYARSEGGGGGGSKTLLVAPRLGGGSLMVRELLQAAKQRNGWPQPDGFTAFLSSMAATQGESLGLRITETAEAGDGVVLVKSLRGPAVRLTREQLRAITQVYE